MRQRGYFHSANDSLTGASVQSLPPLSDAGAKGRLNVRDRERVNFLES